MEREKNRIHEQRRHRSLEVGRSSLAGELNEPGSTTLSSSSSYSNDDDGNDRAMSSSPSGADLVEGRLPVKELIAKRFPMSTTNAQKIATSDDNE